MKTQYVDGRTPAIIKWEKIKERAIARHDAIGYVLSCDNLGIEPEFPEFYQEGCDKIILEKSRLENKVAVEDREYWARLVRAALPRFRELQQGESISAREVRRRLRQIREAGYDVKPYSNMRKGEAWEYLMQIRAYVASQAEKYCPDVLARVRDRNEHARREAFWVR